MVIAQEDEKMTGARALIGDPVSADLIEAAHGVLEKQGPGALTVRAIADHAGISTMAVYSRFGGKGNILEALYRRGFRLLRSELEKVPPSSSSVHDITELAFAYRRFALDNPGLYGFMFERPLPGFDPTLESREEGLAGTFAVLVDRVGAFIEESMGGEGDRAIVSYLIWSALHGELSLELTHSVRTPLPGWILDGPITAEVIYRQVVETVLSGLAIRGQAGGAR
jgi:AcrR family transcriptional regulator